MSDPAPQSTASQPEAAPEPTASQEPETTETTETTEPQTTKSSQTTEPETTEPETTEPETTEPETTEPETVIVLTEVALKSLDIERIVSLHEDEQLRYRVLVPADTERNHLLSSVFDHLMLFELRAAIDELKPRNTERSHQTAETALQTSLRELTAAGVEATGTVAPDDPFPLLEEEVFTLKPREVIVVTEPHAVEDTLHNDWASQAREKLGVPVLHLYTGDWRIG